MLEVNSLGKNLSTQCKIHNVSFSLNPGETLAVLGPSGSGKTSLLRLVLGFDAPDAGTICWEKTLLSEPKKTVVAPENRRFGIVFQDVALFPHLDVAGNVAFGLRHLPLADRRKKTSEWLNLVGLTHLSRREVAMLSGGERQRVALARALAPKPLLLCLDEPFSNVDRLARQELIETLKILFREQKTAVIMVTHDAQDARDLADQVLVIRQGTTVGSGTLQEIESLENQPWLAEFLGAGSNA